MDHNNDFSDLHKSPDFIAGVCVGLAAGIIAAVLIGGVL